MAAVDVSDAAPEAAFTQTSGDPPARVSTLFEKFDANSDGSLTLKELSDALELEFPKLPEYAREQVPEIFAKYAKGGVLNRPQFSKMYAAFLFRNFDADNNGYLDVDETQEALKYLTGGSPMQVALPAELTAADVKVGKAWFWQLYLSMMDH